MRQLLADHLRESHKYMRALCVLQNLQRAHQFLQLGIMAEPVIQGINMDEEATRTEDEEEEEVEKEEENVSCRVLHWAIHFTPKRCTTRAQRRC